MARPLRILFPGARYHVINRGNYRRDVFATAGAARSFESALAQTCERYRWRLHGYVILRNHFHLAVETPEPNLAEGMHWLQTSYATRFNRFRSEHGHLFQGRYKALVVENADALARVIHYIHLNPVRAGLVAAHRITDFLYSSLVRLAAPRRPAWLVSDDLASVMAYGDIAADWPRYLEYLRFLAADVREQERLGFAEMARGWAIGTSGWRRALAKSHAQPLLNAALPADELQVLRQERWQHALDRALEEAQRTTADLEGNPGPADWKIEIARGLRRNAGIPYPWLAHKLNCGSPGALRVAIHRCNTVTG